MGMRERMAARRPVPDHFQEVLLRNATRQRIMDLLARSPGMNKHQLAQVLGINPHAVDFHVRRLVEYGLAETRPGPTNDREALCFTKDNVNLWDDESTRILFGRGVPRRVAAHLSKNPGANVVELSQALSLSVTTVRRHLRILQQAELVQQMRIHRDVIYHAEPELAAWIRMTGDGTGPTLAGNARSHARPESS